MRPHRAIGAEDFASTKPRALVDPVRGNQVGFSGGNVMRMDVSYFDLSGGMDREIGSEKVLILQASAERCAEILNGGGDADAFGGKRIACF